MQGDLVGLRQVESIEGVAGYLLKCSIYTDMACSGAFSVSPISAAY
jgi:hypothetical protein